MTQAWGSIPEFKIESGSNEWVNQEGIQIEVTRRENTLSNAILLIDDLQSKNYVAKFDLFDLLKVSFRYSDQTSSWTQVFEGKNKEVGPSLSSRGEVLGVVAWGLGHALSDTHCSTSYGVESQNSDLNTPNAIWDDLVDNYINKAFGGAATGYSITKTKIADIHNDLSITHLAGKYQSNFDLVCRVCDLVSAHAQASSAKGCHWFVDEDGNLFINTLADHENNGSGWPTYWPGTTTKGGTAQEESTLEVTKDMVLYDFQKSILHPGFANKVVYFGALRKPSYDYWTESGNANGLWDVSQSGEPATDDLTLADDSAAGNYVVGSNSLSAEIKLTKTTGSFFYPSGKTWNLDLTQVGSELTIPWVSFYAAKDAGITNYLVEFYDSAGNDWAHNIVSDLANANEWYHFKLPIGDYWRTEQTDTFRWTTTGNPNWNDVDWFSVTIEGSATDKVWIDDLHIHCDCLGRVAYNSTSIAANHEFQKVVKCDVALDDTMKASDDSGTMAQLAYAELLRRQTQPVVGVIQTPLAVNLLPGQLIHTHAAEKSDGTFRIDSDMRVTELRHQFSGERGATTVISLTDDLDNSFAYGVPTLATLLHEYVGKLGHKEARDLKGGTIDPLVSRLEKDYP